MTGNRNYSLDFLKFLAAVLITNSHFIPIYKDVNVGLATFGVQGNALFFFVAGYLSLMGLERKRESLDNWYRKRIQRLWPTVFIWAILAAILFGDELTWQKILFAPNYWFLQTIAVYYLLFYFIGSELIKRGGEWLLFIFLCISVVSALILPQGKGSIFHTKWHYLCHFSIMLMGALVYLHRNSIKIKNKYLDYTMFLLSFVAYFVVLSIGKNAIDWKWYIQLFALIPLHSFCYYSYKVVSYGWCERLMTNKIWKWPLSVIAALTLEIYVVQFHIITDIFNALFPLTWFVVFFMICVAAYILRISVNVFVWFMGKDEWDWKGCLKVV